MDKKEYQEKLAQINSLIAAEDYEQAARIADSIDWKRVRNVQTLVMISEVYEVLERYEDSKVLLLRAYRRSPVGRTVLYRLVECCIRLRQFDQAIEYYSEYVQAAPHDNNKYILKYKIYQGRGSSLDEQIDILKEYLDQEYNEKWAYELARIEVQAGRVQEGLATCDDLVLWFHSGKYVIRALELKKKYAPLTPKQQEIYDNRFEEEEEPELRPDSYLSEAASLAKAERAAAAQEEIKTELAADISHTAQMEATKAELTRKAEEAQAEVDRKAEEARKALAEKSAAGIAEATAAETAEETPSAEDALSMETAAVDTVPAKEAPAAEETAEETLSAEGALPMESDEAQAKEDESAADAAAGDISAGEETEAPEESVPAADDVLFAEEALADKAPEETAGETAEEELTENESAAEVSAETAEEEGSAAGAESPEEDTAGEGEAEAIGESVSPEQLQADMIRSMREIVSGVGPKEQIGEEEAILNEAIEQSKEDQEEAVAARGTDMTFRVPESEASHKRQAGRLTIDDILLSMGDQGDYMRQVTGGGVMSATQEAQLSAQHQADLQSGASQAGGEADMDPEIPHFLREDVHEARNTTEIPAGQIAEADDALRAQKASLSGEEPSFPGESEADSSMTEAADERENSSEPDSDRTPAGGEAVPEEASKADAFSSDEARAAAAFMSTPRVSYTKEIAEAKTRRLPVDEIRKLHEAYLTEGNTAAQEAAKHASQAAEIAAEMAEAEAAAAAEEAAAGEIDDVRIAKPSGSYGEGEASDRELRPEEETAFQAGAAAAGRSSGQMMRELPKSAPEPKEPEGRPYLKENQMDLFRGFTEIDTLPGQIAGAIWQAENRRDDRTSRSGNILILGAHGCGKTTIATGIAKAVAEDMGTRSVKMARIYAADLNRKDIAATIAKIAGGVLIVEEAGDLDDAIVDQLTTAMEFRTDGLIMILEDEQRYIHDLLMRHPRFTMKFTAQIYIPEYTSEQLVNFGQIYANSKDYVLSEEAAVACRDKVEAARKAGEAVSVTNVIELTDRAMKNANTFFRRIGSAKKRYDSEDRVILREKDFR